MRNGSDGVMNERKVGKFFSKCFLIITSSIRFPEAFLIEGKRGLFY